MFRKEKREVYKNAKCKVYSEDFMSYTICSHKIFKSKLWEKSGGDLIFKKIVDTGWKIDEETGEYYKIKKDKKEVKKPSKYNTSAENVRDDNLKRAKDKVFDIVFLNEWDWFLTITFDDNIVDASDVPLVLKKCNKWLNNQQQRKNLSYILIPEYHKKNKRVHAHALVKGNLTFISSGTYTHHQFKKPVKLSTLKKHNIDLEECQEVFNCNDWKYGFSTGIRVYGDKGALSYYITKYLTKDVKKIFGKFYYSSRDLRRIPDTYYLNISYNDVEGREIRVKNTDLKFKYYLLDNREKNV